MLVKDVTETLERITSALSPSEDKAAVEALIAVLHPHASLSLAQLGTLLVADRTPKKKGAKSESGKKTKAPSVDLALVAHYVAALESKSTDGAVVRIVLSELKVDKRAKVGEVGAILSRVRGSEVKVARKSEGLKEIEQWFQRRRDTNRRVGGASGIY